MCTFHCADPGVLQAVEQLAYGSAPPPRTLRRPAPPGARLVQSSTAAQSRRPSMLEPYAKRPRRRIRAPGLQAPPRQGLRRLCARPRAVRAADGAARTDGHAAARHRRRLPARHRGGVRGDRHGQPDVGRSEYYVAGRRVPAIFNGMATGADWMSAASFIGLAGTLYLSRLPGAGLHARLDRRLCPGGAAPGALPAQFGEYTIPDFLSDRYGGNAIRLVAVGRRRSSPPSSMSWRRSTGSA